MTAPSIKEVLEPCPFCGGEITADDLTKTEKNVLARYFGMGPSSEIISHPLHSRNPWRRSEMGFREGEAPWSEDEQFKERAKACKSRCKKYGYTCGQGGDEDFEFEGQCDECDYEAQEVLQRRYASRAQSEDASRKKGE